MANQLFQVKTHEALVEELQSDNRLRRILGPIQLSSLGIGAIIGTGIFVLTGIAAHDSTGPALVLSFVVSGITCVFAALCYAEFASMVPVAGSAYTYAYATLGELFAWIIGWDLILEYAVASATVAHGWSHYFQDFLAIFHANVPAVFRNAPFDYSPTTGHLSLTGMWFDLPAVAIALIITAILVKGIRESASVNAGIVALKIVIVLFVIVVGAKYVNPANWHPFAPFGLTGVSFFGHTLLGQTGPGGEPIGMLAGAALVFFAYIGFDSVSTHAEEARNPARDVPIGIITSLILCTILYIAVSAVLTGMVPYDKINIDAPVSDAFRQAGLPWAQFLVSAGSGCRDHLGAAGDDAQPVANFSGHGQGRLASRILRRGPRTVPHAVEVHHSDGSVRRGHGRISSAAHSCRPREYRDAAGVRHCLRRGDDHAAHASRSAPPVPRSARLRRSDRGNFLLPAAHVFPARRKLVAALHLARNRSGDLFQLRYSPQPHHVCKPARQMQRSR